MTTANEILKHEASKDVVNLDGADGYIREFHPGRTYWADPDKHKLSDGDETLLTRMAEYLRDAVEGNLDISEAVETHIYRETDNADSYFVRVVLAVGGPYIAIEYDIDDPSADIVGYWGYTDFRIREYGTDLAELCQELA